MKKYVIPNLFRNLEFEIDNELIAFVLVMDSLDSNYYSLEGCKKFFKRYKLTHSAAPTPTFQGGV